MYRGANSCKIACKVLYYWNHSSRLLFFFFFTKIQLSVKPGRENIYACGGRHISHLYGHWKCISFTHNLLYIAAVINFKGSRIHFSNETMTILLLKSLTMSPKKTLHSTLSTIILHTWFSWYGNQRDFTLLNTAFFFKDWVEFSFQGTEL